MNTTSNANVTVTWISTGYPALTARVLFLLLFTLLGFLGNLILLVTIVHSRTFRSSTSNLTLLNVIIVNLLQCSLIAPYVLATTITESWLFGDVMCNIISFLLTCLTIVKILSWVMVSLERVLTIRGSIGSNIPIITNSRLITVIAVMWLYSVIFSVPILFGIIPSQINTTKYVCSFDARANISYTSLLCSFCVLLPIIVIFTLYIIVWKFGVLEKRKVHDLRKHEQFGSNREKLGHIFTINDASIKTELSTTKYSLVLCLLWFVFEVPLTVLIFVQQFHSAIESNYDSIQWYIKFPSVLDTVFTWMMFSYTLVFPCVFLIFMKDIQYKIKQQLLCRRNNSVTDLRQGERSISKIDCKPGEYQRQVSTPSSGYNIPVLFATSKGIQLKTYRNDGESSTPTLETPDSLLNQSANARKLSIRNKCDVMISHDFVNCDETSDYDSSDDVDPYSVSHPVTSKSATKPVLTHKRSTSDPDFNKILHKNKRSKSKPFKQSRLSKSQGMDSGIDVRRSDDSLFSKTQSDVMKISRQSQESAETTITLVSVHEKDRTSEERTVKQDNGQRHDQLSNVSGVGNVDSNTSIPSIVIHCADKEDEETTNDKTTHDKS